MPQTADTTPRDLLKRLGAPIGFGLVCALVVACFPSKHLQIVFDDLDYKVFYDRFFKFRKPNPQLDGPVVIVAADNDSIRRMAKEGLHDWPWPRDKWALVVSYAQECGAKGVVFDILFEQQSRFAQQLDDDASLGTAAAESKIPVVFAVEHGSAGAIPAFAPYDPDKRDWKPLQGNVLEDQPVLRWYVPVNVGFASLAKAALAGIGEEVKVFPDRQFKLHYYGANAFRVIPAADVFHAALPDTTRPSRVVPPEWLKNKIVLVGATATGTFDVKSSPVDEKDFPGVEYQATAIANMLQQVKVHDVPQAVQSFLLVAIVIFAALGSAWPRRPTIKTGFAAMAMALPVAESLGLFLLPTIYWVPTARPLVAAVATVGGALVWSYLIEDRSRKFFTRALTQYVSPAVVDELARHPEKLCVNSERREMTVMFTDIAGFTDLSEKLQAEELARLLNFYLNEMSNIVLSQNGTVDKYVGDAIVSFWNAPLPQADHAVRACRAALAMHRHEGKIAPELARLGGPGLHTRLGLNTAVMAVGNMGCDQKFNYSVLGDSVNLGSRLEAANKMYGTSILVSQWTAAAVDRQFLLRKIDAICVKGKLKPVLIYELMCEAPGEAGQVGLAHDYERALDAYQRQCWDEAEKILIALGQTFAEDGPCKTLRKRIAAFRHEPPPADWDGVFVAKEK